MKTKLIFLSLFLIMFSFAIAQTQDKQYVVNAVTNYEQVPTIDGTADPGEWDDAASPGCTGFVLHNNSATAATEDPEVKAIFDVTYLYILYQVTNSDFALAFDPSANDPGDDGRDPGGLVFSGDDFEFFFFPNGVNSTASQAFYHIVFFPLESNGICYILDEAASARGYPGGTSWDATGDQAAFSYDSGSKLLTIEYKIPWVAFTMTGGVMTTYPASGTEWGLQIGYINNNPSEAVNWEPDDVAGYLNAEPYGKWTFTGVPDMPLVLGAEDSWALYE